LNYVSVQVLRYAAAILKALEEHPDARLACGWQSEPIESPCGNLAEYLVPNGTRISAGGDIERGPQWLCREHLELQLGEPAGEQPIFQRIVGIADPT
jgi:hypothetical protein